MSNIRIDIASEFKDKGFKAAEKRTTSLNRKFDKLARTAKSTFIAIAGIQALKRSVVAFAEEDRAANKLATSLRNLGLAYDTKAIEDYLEASEKDTAINKDELTPAITQLLSTTLNAQKSMTLLNLAMDIATSTSRDLGSVTTALSRAFNGNFASLGKLQTAYTTAELEAMGFDKTVTALNEQFGGAAENNADTYAGKIDKMKIAFGDLAEEIGKGIVQFLESLGDGDYDKGLQKLVNFGQAIGDVFRRAGLTIEYTKALLATGFRIDAAEQLRLDELRAQMANPRAGSFGVSRGNLADYRKQQQLQKKIEADRKKAAALAAKSEKDKLQREREALQLKRAGTIFDLENIQIVAALQGRISEEQRVRLIALLAINNDNAEAADKLTAAILALQGPALASLGITIKTSDNAQTVIDRLINAQTKLLLLNSGITTIPKAKNPFEDWDKVMAKIIADIGKISQSIKNIPGISVGGTTVGNTTVSGVTPGPFPAQPSIGEGPGKPYLQNLSPELQDTFASLGINSQTLFDLQLGAEGDYVNINVNVQGSVVTAQDLAETITDIQYQYQKSGKSLLLNSVQI